MCNTPIITRAMTQEIDSMQIQDDQIKHFITKLQETYQLRKEMFTCTLTATDKEEKMTLYINEYQKTSLLANNIPYGHFIEQCGCGKQMVWIPQDKGGAAECTCGIVKYYIKTEKEMSY